LVTSSLAVVAAGIIIPLTALGRYFQFSVVPAGFFVFLIVFVGVYLALAELLKRYFYKRYSHMLEQEITTRKASRSRFLRR